MVETLENTSRYDFQFDMVNLLRADMESGNQLGIKDIEGLTDLIPEDEFNIMKKICREFIIEEIPDMIAKGILVKNKVNRQEPIRSRLEVSLLEKLVEMNLALVIGKKYKKCCGVLINAILLHN